MINNKTEYLCSIGAIDLGIIKPIINWSTDTDEPHKWKFFTIEQTRNLYTYVDLAINYTGTTPEEVLEKVKTLLPEPCRQYMTVVTIKTQV